MINKKKVFLVLLVLPFLGFSQGIEFDHISLDEALSKAKNENKLVFIDFYTVWCGPCKKMAKTVFPLPEVGEVYNKSFVSLKLDAEKEGEAVAKQYNVTGYPTLMYLDTDGNVLLRDTAFNPTDEFIASAQKALASLNSANSLENLQKEFPNRLKDEQFLKMYIEEMKLYGQTLSEGIDAWLSVQTEMDEASPEMMKYVMDNARNFVVGGKGDRILDENIATYLENASPFEGKMLPRLKMQIIYNTKKVAERNTDPQLMKRYIEAYKNNTAVKVKEEEIVEAQLMYYNMIKDNISFKAQTESYVASLISENTIAKVYEADEQTYQLYKKAYDKDPAPERERMLMASKAGLKADKILKELNEKGKGYLERITSKKEFKTLNGWIEYGYNLKADNCFMNDLKAEVYYKQGKSKKAIALKERAVKNWPRSDKKFINKEYEMEQMKNGEEI
ncbi:thioredoxin family protein [Tamlana flava]|uniref:thioredoxin family protein n=1 Tax=Tamlana flava TaxID=3158572 RepID=UPI00351B2098